MTVITSTSVSRPSQGGVPGGAETNFPRTLAQKELGKESSSRPGTFSEWPFSGKSRWTVRGAVCACVRAPCNPLKALAQMDYGKAIVALNPRGRNPKLSTPKTGPGERVSPPLMRSVETNLSTGNDGALGDGCRQGVAH